jgi:hypothetical protein
VACFIRYISLLQTDKIIIGKLQYDRSSCCAWHCKTISFSRSNEIQTVSNTILFLGAFDSRHNINTSVTRVADVNRGDQVIWIDLETISKSRDEYAFQMHFYNGGARQVLR